jgi:hypothetical protein
MVNTAQRQRGDFGMLAKAHILERATISDRSIRPIPDESTVLAEIESPEEKLNHLAAEIGGASWKDGAALGSKTRYSYDVVEM